MKKIFYTVVFIISFNRGRAQENNFTKQPDATVFKEVSAPGWVKFQDNYNTAPEKVFEINKQSFGLGADFKMIITRSRDDDYGYRHIKFQETYRDIKVLGGEYFIHAKNGKAVTGNGKIITPPLIKTTRVLSEQAALLAALSIINAKSYYWQDVKRELRLKQKTKDPMATYHPKAEMIYVPSADRKALSLCYSFVIRTTESFKSAIYYIDAASGTIVKKTPLEYQCAATTVDTNHYGTRALFTNNTDDGFDLEDDCQESVYGVYEVRNNDDIFNSPNNTWTGDWLRSAATSLWLIKECYVLYRDIFGRFGHDHDDGDIDIYQGYVFDGGSNNNAAYWYDPIGDDEIRVGIGNTPSLLDDWNTMDILGHEFTHGVTKYEADLDYEKESGALNESFSDIMGEWLESKVLGSANWLHGWERVVNNCHYPTRSLIDPAAGIDSLGGNCIAQYVQPNTYGGDYWKAVDCDPDETNDRCGVHTNGGVQNQMFYLLSVGGNGWNNGKTCHAPVDSGYSWNVSAIGIDNAARIAYKVLNDFLTSGSGYHDVRNAWVHAAENIFGPCSFEAIQTGKAWYAVGIGPPSPQTLFLCNTAYGSTPYNLIASGNIITSPGCTVTILNTGNQVEFKSGSRIALNPGFTSFIGSSFKAGISDCGFAAY
jgi:bacillolysin